VKIKKENGGAGENESESRRAAILYKKDNKDKGA